MEFVMSSVKKTKATLLPKSPLLITESADEFIALHDAFEQEIKPHGIIEQMYVGDISFLVWEIMRLRRAKTALINERFRHALEELLEKLLEEPDYYSRSDEAKALALQ